MVYNHLRDKVKSFLQPFAESGKAVGAEDIKAYFETLRGDAEAIRAAGGNAVTGGEEGDGDGRREQSGEFSDLELGREMSCTDMIQAIDVGWLEGESAAQIYGGNAWVGL